MDIDLFKINLFNLFAIIITLMEMNTIVIIVVGLSAIVLNIVKTIKLLKGDQEPLKNSKQDTD